MMRAILLAPGPSLAALDPMDVPAGDLRLGVNRAAIRHRCDVWVACDAPLIEQIQDQVLGVPLLVTSPDSRSTIDTHKKSWRGEVFTSEKMFSYAPHVLNWVLFSFTTALFYAAYRGATRIDVYGCDWAGVKDFDGVEAGKNRGEARWKTEREHTLNRFIPWLKEHGCEVELHQPQVPEAIDGRA